MKVEKEKKTLQTSSGPHTEGQAYTSRSTHTLNTHTSHTYTYLYILSLRSYHHHHHHCIAHHHHHHHHHHQYTSPISCSFWTCSHRMVVGVFELFTTTKKNKTCRYHIWTISLESSLSFEVIYIEEQPPLPHVLLLTC